MTMEELTKAIENISAEQLTRAIVSQDKGEQLDSLGEKLATLESKIESISKKSDNGGETEKVDAFNSYLKDCNLVK